MEFVLNNHYKIVYLYFSVFQLVLTNCFSISARAWARAVYLKHKILKKKILTILKISDFKILIFLKFKKKNFLLKYSIFYHLQENIYNEKIF